MGSCQIRASLEQFKEHIQINDVLCDWIENAPVDHVISKIDTKVINKKISNLNVSDEIIKTVTIDNKEYAIDGLFIENGYTPNIDFIKSLNIKLDNNYIVVDENMKTNIDGIYASGDIIKKKVYQIVTAASDGAVAALSIIKDLK